MKSPRCWLTLQVVMGIWLIICPFALGFWKITGMTINDVIVGVIVVILGIWSPS